MTVAAILPTALDNPKESISRGPHNRSVCPWLHLIALTHTSGGRAHVESLSQAFDIEIIITHPFISAHLELSSAWVIYLKYCVDPTLPRDFHEHGCFFVVPLHIGAPSVSGSGRNEQRGRLDEELRRPTGPSVGRSHTRSESSFVYFCRV